MKLELDADQMARIIGASANAASKTRQIMGNYTDTGNIFTANNLSAASGFAFIKFAPIGSKHIFTIVSITSNVLRMIPSSISSPYKSLTKVVAILTSINIAISLYLKIDFMELPIKPVRPICEKYRVAECNGNPPIFSGV